MFEPIQYVPRCPGWLSPLRRLNRTLFLMVIDPTFRTASHYRDKSTFNTTSNFIRPNQ